MSRYTQRKDGEGWEQKSGEIWKLTCCDCGLVHRIVLTTKRHDELIGIAAERDNRATAQRRRRCAFAKQKLVLEQLTTYAKSIASHMAQHWQDTAPDWKPLDDLMGILSQIDNMASGMTRRDHL